MNDESNESAEKSDKEILRVALERFRLAEEAEADLRREALDDLNFSVGDQWPEQVKRQRERQNRPCLVINRLPQSIHQLTNDQRQNRPAIKVSPFDDNADKDTAEVFQGLIRNIEVTSNADTAFDTGFDSTVRCGFGYVRVVSDFCDPFSFDQELRIKRIPDRFSVYLDPHYNEPDGSDAEWGFVFEDLSHDDYRTQYPDSDLTKAQDWSIYGSSRPQWFTEKTVRIAEYLCKEYARETIVLLSNGLVVKKSDLPQAPAMLPDGLTVVKERESLVPTVKWYKINGTEILDRSDFPGSGQWIPIIPILGEDLVIDGKRILSGLVRHAKDPQKQYNYFASAETEAIALAPKAPFIGYAGQFEGFEDKWETANTENHAYLEANSVTLDGKPAPLPSRNFGEPAVQAISNARMLASEDLKATTGIYDAALGARSNENSGIAIQRRNLQSQTANFHFIDNLSKSIRHVGRILVDAIPFVYDTARAVRILGEDGQEEIVKINQVFERRGQQVRYDLGVGKYDVSVSTGPSFETKRQEAAASMIEFTKALPAQAAAIADLVAKNLDWPGAHEISERLRKMLPPGIAEDKDQKPIPPEVQQQLGQMNQLIEQLTNELNQKSKVIEMKTAELESKERIEFAKMELDASKELAKLQSKEALSLLSYQVQQINQRLALLDMNEPIDMEAGGAQHEMQEQGLAPEQAEAMPMMNQEYEGFQDSGAGSQSADGLPESIMNPEPTGGPQLPGDYMGEYP